ncbi:acyltransferase [Moheibacter stercoris]|uniref:Acetyltransferase-like isoleucine patch superfamily enzyme n=1 Tax=Moheibacter stercoris TaxID=1628251 RepID=A0ABV2LPP4_9FLAO
MIKKLLRPLYVPLVHFIYYLKYYKVTNLISKANVQFTSSASFQQKTFFTGNGTIKIGEGCCFGFKPGGFHYGGSIELQARTPQSLIEIGNDVKTNNNIFICSAGNIKIGNRTLIGQGVCIMDFEAHGVHPDERNKLGEIGTIIIEENVWIGNNVTILKNTKIGKNTIVAAGAVVSGIFPDNVIIGGVPSKIIKSL